MSSEKICDWERHRIDEDDIPDILDDYFRWVDKLKYRVKDLEADIEQHILLEEIKDKKIRELTQKVVTLETKLKMYERGSE